MWIGTDGMVIFWFAAWNETGFGSESDRHARRCRSRQSRRLREAVLIRDTIITTIITTCIIITPIYMSPHRTSSVVVPSGWVHFPFISRLRSARLFPTRMVSYTLVYGVIDYFFGNIQRMLLHIRDSHRYFFFFLFLKYFKIWWRYELN